MASKTTLNARNLEALGAARLAELLMELSVGDAAAKRRLRLEIAGAQGAGDVAREVRRRLGLRAKARGFVDWRRIRALVEDLDTQRRAIAERVAPEGPTEAMDLMWRFLALAGPVQERCGDSAGHVGDVFRDALADLGEIAARARPDPEGLADQAFHALQDNGHGQHDGLIAALAPALGKRGLAHLERRVEVLGDEPIETPTEEDEVIGWGPAGPVRAHEMALRERRGMVRLALMDIADAPVATWTGSSTSSRRRPAGRRRSRPRSPFGCSRPGARRRRWLPSTPRRRNAPPGCRAGGTRPGSRRSTRWGRARRRRPRAGRASRRRCRRPTCARTSSTCPTSRTSRRRSGRWASPRAIRASSRRWPSSSAGRRSTAPPPLRGARSADRGPRHDAAPRRLPRPPARRARPQGRVLGGGGEARER